MVGNKFGNLVTRGSISARKLAADRAMVSLCPYDQAIDFWLIFYQDMVRLYPCDQAMDMLCTLNWAMIILCPFRLAIARVSPYHQRISMLCPL